VGEQFLTHAVKVLDALNTAGQSLHRKEEHTSEVVRVGPCPPPRWAFFRR
jgi:DNA-binding transcriptional LysR family regulator